MEEPRLAGLVEMAEAAEVAVLAVVVRLGLEAVALRSRGVLVDRVAPIQARTRLEAEVAVLAVLERNP